MTVISLFIFNSLKEVYKNKNNLKRTRDIHTYNTGNKNKLIIPITRLKRTAKQGYCLKIKLYNELPPTISELPELEFKRKMEKFLIKNPFYKVKKYIDLMHL